MSIFDTNFLGGNGIQAENLPTWEQVAAELQAEQAQAQQATFTHEVENGPSDELPNNFLLIIDFLGGQAVGGPFDDYDEAVKAAESIAETAHEAPVPVLGIGIIQVPDDSPVLAEVKREQQAAQAQRDRDSKGYM